jgi:hypothetical protein
LLANFFKGLNKEEGRLVIALLIGENPYGKIGLGYQSLKGFLNLKPAKKALIFQ